jgi:hypothetical protein
VLSSIAVRSNYSPHPEVLQYCNICIVLRWDRESVHRSGHGHSTEHCAPSINGVIIRRCIFPCALADQIAKSASSLGGSALSRSSPPGHQQGGWADGENQGRPRDRVEQGQCRFGWAAIQRKVYYVYSKLDCAKNWFGPWQARIKPWNTGAYHCNLGSGRRRLKELSSSPERIHMPIARQQNSGILQYCAVCIPLQINLRECQYSYLAACQRLSRVL